MLTLKQRRAEERLAKAKAKAAAKAKAKTKVDKLFGTAAKQYLDGELKKAEKNVNTVLRINETHVAAKRLERKLTKRLKLPQPFRTYAKDGTYTTTSMHGTTIHKDSNGRFLKGFPTNFENRRERLNRRSQGRISEDLLDAIEYVETSKRKNLYVYFVERAFKSEPVLIALMKKVLPDLKAVEALVGAFNLMPEEEAQEIRDELKSRFEMFQQQVEGGSRKLLESTDETTQQP